MARKRKGVSEREYAERIGRSRVAVQDMKRKKKLVMHADGSIDPDASDARRAEMERAAATALEASPRLAQLREAIEEQKLRGHVLRNDREASALIDRHLGAPSPTP
jgi:transposase